MLSDTLTRNLCLVRVHAFVPREILLLQSQDLSLRFSTSSVQSVQANVENPQETARPQASANTSWNCASVLLDGRTLKTLAPRYGLTHQGLSRRFRRALRPFVSRSRALRLPRGPLVLLLDGLYFRFRGKDWVLYVMAVKPCHPNRAVFLDPVLQPGRENLRGWSQAITTIPDCIHRRIRASVSDAISGIIMLVRATAGSSSSAISISSVACRTAEADEIADWRADPCAKRFTNMLGKLSRCPMLPVCIPCSKNSGILFAKQQACASCA